jgi:hypothetical protein
VFNTTFSKHFSYIISINLVVEEAEYSEKNHRPWTSNRQTLSLASRVHSFLLFTKPGANPSRIGDIEHPGPPKVKKNIEM